jgi:hypothetical protein
LGNHPDVLVGAARVVRDALVDPFHFRGLTVERMAFLRAFDQFHDPLVKRFLDGKPYENEAKQQLDIIKQIENAADATPWSRAHALWKLINGEREANVRTALCMQEPHV